MQPVTIALAAITLCPSASLTTLTGMPFRTWRQYHILLLLKVLFGQVTKDCVSVRSTSEVLQAAMWQPREVASASSSLSFQFRQAFPQAHQRLTGIANFTQARAGDAEIALGSAATLGSGVSKT